MAKKTKKTNKGIVLIKKSNNLIESRYKFDIWETRFFLSVLAQIRREDQEFKVYKIWYKDIIKTFELKSGDSYSHLREAAKSLMGKSFFVNYEEDGIMREKQYHILREIDYMKGGQEDRSVESHEYIDVTVEQKMKPFLLQLQANFTSYDLRNIVRLGVYPVRVYELLKQYERIGKRKLDVNEMRVMFEVAEQYKLFGDFYRWIIKPAVKQINKYTDLTVTDVKKVKEGRRVVALWFYFQGKGDKQLKQARGEKMKEQLIFNVPKEATQGKDVKASKGKKFGDSEAESIVEPLDKDVFDNLYLKVKDWMEEAVLKKLLLDFPKTQVKRAIDYTLKRLQKGHTINNVAGHIIGMVKQEGFIDPDQIKKEKYTSRKLEQKAVADKKLKLEAEQKQLYNDKDKQEKIIINAILLEFPESLNDLVDKTKERPFSKYDSRKTVEENLADKFFGIAFRRTVMEIYSDRFMALNKTYDPKIAVLKKQINQL